MTINEEVPTLSFSRGDLMPVAFAMRTLADVLKLARERRGRAAWGDTTNVDRIEQIAEANGLRPFSPSDADEWVQARESDRASADFDRITEMTIRVAPLSGDRWGVQAGWQDNNAAAVVGSRKMADELVRWLQINSTPESIDDFRAAAGDVHEAVQWLRQEPAARETTTTASEGPITTDARQNPLADRLRGRVADDILDNPRWSAAEAQYSSLVAHGVDPDLLVETVAGIDFTAGIRVPSGYAAWAMRDAAKNGAEPDSTVKSEEDARREVATEWLSSAESDNPLDRARAAQLVGQLDDGFDAAIAMKFPGILNADAGSAILHEASARDEDAAAGQEDQAADSVAQAARLIVVSPDGSAVLPFEPFDAEAETEVPRIFGDDDQVADHEGSREAVRARAGDHTSDATDERGQAEEDSKEATAEAAQPTEAARNAARPLLAPTDPRQSRRAPAPATRPRVVAQPTSSRTRTRRPTA